MSEQQSQWATREDVREMGRSIEGHLEQWKREMRERGDERHRDNLGRMDGQTEQLAEMLIEARKTNGRITTLEVETRTLKDEFKAIRQRWHDFRDSIVKSVSDTGGLGENRKITMRDVTLFGAGIGLFYAFAKILKWLP
jgi:predicted nuclease with TOPRIM domain